MTGMGYDEALNAAAAAGLTLTVTHKEFTHDCSTPTIKSQAVQAGGKAGADGVVGVEVLLPWHSFQMPNLNYRTEQDASQILANMGVQANVSQESSDLIAAGLVFAQGRAKGEALEPGTAVKITVSKGGKPFAMPGVVGLDESRARAVLAEMGLAVEIEYDFDAGVKEGNVISQSVSANTDVTRGTTVKIVVCSKKDLITVASVVGMDQGTAESAIKGQGLKVTINLIESSDSQKGLVISQLPEAGSSQKAGTTIVLTVGKGAPKKADPKPSNPTPTPTPDPTPDPTPVKKTRDRGPIGQRLRRLPATMTWSRRPSIATGTRKRPVPRLTRSADGRWWIQVPTIPTGAAGAIGPPMPCLKATPDRWKRGGLNRLTGHCITIIGITNMTMQQRGGAVGMVHL